MSRVTILGAGDMGTALTTPLAANGHDVRLWGTARDAAIVAALRDGGTHPRLGTATPPSVRVFADDEAREALAGAEIVVVAITSDAVRAVVGAVAPHLGSPRAVVTVAKGFDETDGRFHLLPDVIAELCDAPVVAVGGPSKANEVARGRPTAVVFASADAEATRACREAFATATYRIETSDDIIGVEVAAAMKNAYAIALGMTDGFERCTGQPHHNLRAALFPRAVREMGALAEALGGRRATVDGLAGCGDLQVTITSGRNRLLGGRIGFGEPPRDALATLTAAGTTVEGYLAAGYGYRLINDLVASGRIEAAEVALLRSLWRILHEGAPPLEALWAAIPDREPANPS